MNSCAKQKSTVEFKIVGNGKQENFGTISTASFSLYNFQNCTIKNLLATY
ncbi:hypothetical protein KSS87_012552, partial [Heliosperma pusillum]